MRAVPTRGNLEILVPPYFPRIMPSLKHIHTHTHTHTHTSVFSASASSSVRGPLALRLFWLHLRLNSELNTG